MSSKLDWGIAESANIPAERFVVDDGGYRLFCVSGQEVRFPERDVRVLPFLRPSAIGWVNTNPIAFDVENRRFLTSADDHKFFWSAHLTLRVQDSLSAWERVVRTQTGLQPLIEALIEDTGRNAFRCHSYKSIFNEDLSLFADLEGSLARRIAEETPYNLLALRFEVASQDPALDEALAQTRRTKALNGEWGQTRDIAESELQYARAAEFSEQDHRTSLAKIEADARRELETHEARHQLQLEMERSAAFLHLDEAASLSQARVLERMIALFGGDTTRAVLSRDANLLSRLAMAEVEAGAKSGALAYKTGLAEGSIKAINALLRDQDLTESGHTIRIINEDGSRSDDNEGE